MSETTKERFLASLEIFEALGDEIYAEELSALAAICDEYEFEDGAVIAYQRDVADSLLMVRSGRLFARTLDNRGIVRNTRSYLPGDYFEDIWLFVPGTYPATVNAAGDGRILVLEASKFLKFLETYPYVLEELKLSEEARDEAERGRIALPKRQARSLSLLADEIVEYEARRSIWLLVFKSIWPGLAFLALAAFILLDARNRGVLILVAAIIPAILLALFMLFQLVDWANDYFVITNKHLVHRELDLRRFRAKIDKIPIDQIQSVEVERPNLLATLLNTGTARITTAAQAGVLLFDYIDNPELVRDTIGSLREQVRAMDAGRIQATMRASLEEHFQSSPIVQKVKEPEDGEETPEAALGRFGALLHRISLAVSSRVEEGNVITYRKHYFTLLTRTWWQILAGLAFFAGLVLVSSIELALFFLALWLIDFAWFVWRFEDWRNDTFQVTDRYVIDVDRRPFGFGESRKQAELGNVQNVNAVRPSALATIFNYGNVVIETAGATADITFETVVNPNRIQSDIFKRREEFRQRQRVQEGGRRRKEYAVMLDVYQQAQEQRRIPRRTPTDDS